jgi:hypothetical protein
MMRAGTATVILAALFVPRGAGGADDLAVWNDFSRAFRDGRITAERIRPYSEEMREPFLRFIATIRAQAKPEDWEKRPEIHRVGDQIHFLIPLTTEGDNKTTYCFTVVTEGETWFFQHMEAIFIRLDQIGPLPVSRFPDVTNDQKNWMREEIAMTERVRLFNLLAKEKGKPFAFQWFKDGAGYLLAARTWVPFVPAMRAFILYACWEQSNLRGRPVTLTSLDDRQAVVDLDAGEWRLYEQTGHLRQMISREDYRTLYETVWQDRAAAAGWDLRIEYIGAKVRLCFQRHQAEGPEQ